MTGLTYYYIGRGIMWFSGVWGLINLLIFLLSGLLSGGFYNLFAAIILLVDFFRMRKATNDFREKELDHDHE